ncbi:MAG: alanine racemase [Rhizobiales bacterium 62-47]|nr:alanine racemase [Hyphomicrobiales bacterium]OJY12387.1 MAG: alanine racemase [Rhizobiales bacterium 62-47]
MSDGARYAGAVLTIDLAAVRRNYRSLRSRLGPRVRCAAVVKADAYGLGARYVAPALHAEGCRDFFVAHLEEGLSLRPHLPAAPIYVLNGLPIGGGAECINAGLVPVLNSVAQAEAWSRCARALGRRLPAVIQIDSGMNRLGMTERELSRWVAAGSQFAGIDVQFVMSHLACADARLHAANAMQIAKFQRLAQNFPGSLLSLANSAGVFLGGDFHFDLVRPGSALYGINPLPGQANPMRAVVRLNARVIQIRDIDKGAHVGYGWDFCAEGPLRLATLSIGYADGLHRVLGKNGAVYCDGRALPIVGRVSMDSITIDISELPRDRIVPGSEVEVIGDHQSVDDLAEAMGTIGYEVLTSLGRRFERNYLGATDVSSPEFAGELLS